MEKSGRQAFLLLTKNISKRNVRFYNEISKAAFEFGDVFFLYHTSNNATANERNNVQIFAFSDNILVDLDYKPVFQTVVPGSNHFPVLNFFLNKPGYDNYWCIEDDVAFNGNWADFFKAVSNGPDYDFISSHIRRYADIPNWHWWPSFHDPENQLKKTDLLSSFNPIYRISKQALSHIDDLLKKGYIGHHEVIYPTLLHKCGFQLADFGTEENHITPLLRFCTLTTMRWKPVFFIKGAKKNTLYHPVKENITFRQALGYIKRTLLKRKKYYS